MPAVSAILHAGKRRFDRREMRTRHMALAIEAFAFAVIHQIVATIENHPSRVIAVRR